MSEETPVKEKTEPETLVDSSFLRNIKNPNFFWVFEIIGKKKVTARVISFLWDPRGVPITLMTQPREGEAFEIPWSSIQTIKREKE